MPNRILREGILESARINALSLESELFYRRLMSVVDDYGRFHAAPVLLRSKCYPRRIDQVSDKKVQGYLEECREAGVLVVYEVDGESYLEVCKFQQHVRAKHSKFPPPPADAMQVQCTRVANAHPNVDVVEDVDVDEVADEIPKILDTPAFLEAWKRYHDYRKQSRIKRLIPKSRQTLLKQLAEWGEAAALESIERTIANGYQGLFPPKKGGTHATHPYRPKGHTGVNSSAGY